MGVLDFLASLVHALAWPTALVLVVFILRRSLRRLIDRVMRASWKDSGVELDEAAEAVESAVRTAVEPESEVTARLLARLEDNVSRHDSTLQEAHRDVALVEAQRRRAIQEVIQRSLKYGWEAAESGLYDSLPELTLRWSENGSPLVTVGWNARHNRSAGEIPRSDRMRA